jgi:ribosomal protein L32
MERSTANQKHKSKPAIRLNHKGHKLNKVTKNKNCGSIVVYDNDFV